MTLKTLSRALALASLTSLPLLAQQQSDPPRALTAAEQRENTNMPWLFYMGMTDEDLGAIYQYLRSLKPVVNRVKKFN